MEFNIEKLTQEVEATGVINVTTDGLLKGIDTVEKILLWSIYQLFPRIIYDKISIDGKSKYLLNNEFLKEDKLNDDIYLISKIYLPIDSDWESTNGKLWESALEVTNEQIYITPFFDKLNGYCQQNINSLNQLIFDADTIEEAQLNGYCNQDINSLNQLIFNADRIVIEILNGYCQQQL